ncbi:hypothetical protein C8R43DRAFT_1127210 [Mycena crocata]|nr:hypothetical protein C8R43DRAFT_1127210 [Mycena crocata]
MLDAGGAFACHWCRWGRASPPSSLPRHSTRRHRRLFLRRRLNLKAFNIDPTMHQVHVIAALPPPPPTTTFTTCNTSTTDPTLHTAQLYHPQTIPDAAILKFPTFDLNSFRIALDS